MTPTLPILCEDPPKPIRLAGLGERYRYWRGLSGRRHLFTEVPASALADFRSVVVLFAEPQGDGGFVARMIASVDAAGRGLREGRNFGERGTRLRPFVHFLAVNDAECRRLVDDLSAVPIRLAA